MTHTRAKSIPLPCALLALSVAVCLGAAGPVEASAVRAVSSSQAEQRQSLEHLLEAIQQAAKKLTDQLDGQIALYERQGMSVSAPTDFQPSAWASCDSQGGHLLREVLLNLPPPSS